nr:aldehyde dehydrogenase family 3 member F1-like [Tanacetum cinerariifolium]
MANDLEPDLKELRDTFNSGKTKEYSWRISQLRGLLHLLEDRENDIFLALKKDLGKHHVEAYRDEVELDNPNITMKEYIRLEEKKARRHGKEHNWETTTYGRIWYDDDVHDLRYVETEFPTIVFNDTLTSEVTLSCEPTASSLNDNEIDFRISFDESEDEDYTVIFDKNSFSYKIISVDDLKTDSKNDNDKINMPSFLSPEPTVSYFDDLDYFKDFEKEFPAIVYNDALTSKFDFLNEPTINPQHIDESNLKDKTSLFECDEEEQNVLYFNDLSLFNIIYPDNSKSDKDINDKKFNIKQPWEDVSVIPLSGKINTDVGAYVRRPKSPNTPYWIPYGYGVPIPDLYGGLEYTDADITNFDKRLERIYGRGVHRGQSMFTSRAWRRLFEIRGPLVHELIMDFFSTFRFRESVLNLDTGGALQFHFGRVRRRISSTGDLLGTTLYYTSIRDPMLRLCHRLIACNIARRSQAPEKICEELDDTWVWVAPGPERQPDAAAGAPEVVEGALDVDEGAQAIPAPVQVPQPLPTVAQGWTMPGQLGVGLMTSTPQYHNSQTPDLLYHYF